MDTRQTSKHRAALFAAVAIVALALVPAAFADKGGNGGGKNGTPTMSGFNLYVLDSSTSLWIENAQPTHGGTVKFEVPATVSQPNVELDCSQNGAVVYSALSGWYETGAWTRSMSLSSQAWTGGAASCTATLYYISGLKTVTVGTLSFTAGA